MKLVELLAKELEEWADTTLCYTQDSDGNAFPWVTHPTFFQKDGVWVGTNQLDQNPDALVVDGELSSDYASAVVTKEMWLAERNKLEKLNAPDVAPFEVGGIGNYYGGLSIKRENGTPYWGIENYDGTYWEEISEELYNLLKELRRGED